MYDPSSRRIQVLRDSVASKIAAGEVIDRPFSILRELLDNALDAGSTQIDVRLQEGGIRLLEVRDDGQGMTREDLELCWLPHATSKILHEDDLQALGTLGFRGEALSAVTACARLTIETSRPGETSGYRLQVDHLHQPQIQTIPAAGGTRVRSEDLFHSIPARRRFLKTPGAEALACQKTLEEKALAFPQVAFKLYLEDKLKIHLPAEPLLKRAYRLYSQELAVGMMDEIILKGEGFSGTLLTSRPGLNRSDRKMVHIYANKRKIQEYAFVQAVCHAYGEFLPGGMFPLTFVFLEVDPDLVDFNIHPAKKEARFRNQARIHSRLVETLRRHLEGQRIQSPLAGREAAQPGLFDRALNLPDQVRPRTSLGEPSSAKASPRIPGGSESSFFEAYQRVLSQNQEKSQRVQESGGRSYRYLGQIMGVFLLVEWEERLFIVDQHAAHERILYDSFQEPPIRSQELLLPLEFLLDPERAELLAEREEECRSLGITWETIGPGKFLLKTIPEKCLHLEGEILKFLTTQEGSTADLRRDLFARMSCRAAVMDGDLLDHQTACSLLDQAFLLKEARCPHGRPVWMEFSRQDLYRMFGRIV